MKINLSDKEKVELIQAMKRVGNEIELHENTTSSFQFNQFLEDLKLILFELHTILESHEENEDDA